MNRYGYVRAETVQDAVAALAGDNAYALAGGTNLVDLMKYDVEKPSTLVDITRLPLNSITETDDGGLLLGALTPNADTAYDERVARRYPLLASAILAGASPQLRNAATDGGNLLQRTRCFYFYDPCTPCNKRELGSGCPAKTGRNRILAILGASDKCIATHPSDMCVALAALEAKVHVTGPSGDRVIAFDDFHRLPGDAPDKDNTLRHGELITSIELPPSDYGAHHTYLKIRDRLSYAFALVSAAAAMTIEDGRMTKVRLALGGVAAKPWRDIEAERELEGRPPEVVAFKAAADRILRHAQGYGDNDFKIELARRVIVRALSQAAAGAPQSHTDKRIQ